MFQEMDVESKKDGCTIAGGAVSCFVVLSLNVASPSFLSFGLTIVQEDAKKETNSKKIRERKPGNSIQVFHLCNTQFFCFNRIHQHHHRIATPNTKLNWQNFCNAAVAVYWKCIHRGCTTTVKYIWEKSNVARACVNMNGFFFIFIAAKTWNFVKHVKMCLLSLQ